MGMFSVSQAVPRTEDPRLLQGRGRYIDDVALPGMAYGYVLRSPHAHARIRGIDTAAAKAAPGVIDVLTGEDYLAEGFNPMPHALMPIPGFDPEKIYKMKHLPLTVDEARYVGDPVAFIVAETRAQAKDAAELVEVDYEPLPAITDTGRAPEPDAALVWQDCPNNTAYVFNQGNIEATDAAFAKADHVITKRMVINRLSAMPMETRGVAVDYDPERDFCTVYLGTQNTWSARTQIAKGLLNLPEEKFRVVAGDVGGSFGMKGGMYPETPLAVWAARRVKRPVKWVSERGEAFMSDAHARDKVVDAELALDKDYKILGMRVHAISNIGAYYSTLSTFPIILSTSGYAGVYATPAIHFKATAVFTNTNPTTPYRGSGRPDAAYVCERIVDYAARELGVDPAELRRRNLIPKEAMPYQTPLGPTYDSGDFPGCMALALEKADYANFESRRKEAETRGKLRGLGIGNNVEGASPPGQEMAKIEIDATGAVSLAVGSTDQGQGHATMYTQIASQYLGVDSETIRVTEGDTGTLEQGFGAGGSKVSALGSSAVYEAVRQVIDKGKQIAANVLEAAASDIVYENGVFAIAGTDRSVSLGELAKAAEDPANLTDGMEPGLSLVASHKTSAPTYPGGCHVCELEIDRDTGLVQIVRYVAVTDVGVSINPTQVKGQIHGGIVQALGQVLSEGIVYDADSGQLLTGSFMDYGMPRGDSGCAIETYERPTPTTTNPLGVKGTGEVGTGCAVPAILNAVVDALSPLGIHHIDMPATGERIWQAIHGTSRA